MSPEAVLSIVEVEPGTFAISGEIDAYSAPTLAARLLGTDASVVLDLAGVTFMDSSGLRVIIQVERRERTAGRSLVITRPTAAVSRLFEIGGLSELLDADA